MSNPLGVLPLALAAHGGSIDGRPASQLVAAGITLLQRCAPLARALYGKRSGILLPTGCEFLIALAASDGRGAVLLNPLASPSELAYQLTDASVGAVFTLAALAGKVPEGMPLILLDDAPATAAVRMQGAISTIDLGSHVGLSLEADAEAEDGEGSDEESTVVYTSAMAGAPLGAILTHRNLLANARATVRAAGMSSSDHLLAVLPYSHLFGMTVTLSAPLLAGARITTMDRFSPMKTVDALMEGDVSVFVGVPSVFIGMLTAIERRGGTVALPSLRVCICGGAPLPVWVQRKWEAATGCPLRQGYGLTEASPVCLFNDVAQPNRIGTLGSVYPGAEITIRDQASSAEVPVGASGEICVRGPFVGPGYVSGDERGLRRVDGWLHTGDQGSMDADGYVTFEGVIKPMFTRNGFNIYPAELQRVIGAMPGVTQVEVTAIPDTTREHGIDVTVHGAVTVTQVTEWCTSQLASYKQPTQITVVA